MTRCGKSPRWRRQRVTLSRQRRRVQDLWSGWLNACPKLVELESVEERNRLDHLVVTHREEPRIGVRVRFAVPRGSVCVEKDDHGVAVGVQIPHFRSKRG